MNERQKRFAELFAASANATEAAVGAGYSPRTARSIGCENLTKPDIVQYVKVLQSQFEGDRIADIEEIKSFWTGIMRDKQEKTESRLKASELLCRSAGGFIQEVKLDAEIDTTAEEVCDVVFYIPSNGRPVILDSDSQEIEYFT